MEVARKVDQLRAYMKITNHYIPTLSSLSGPQSLIHYLYIPHILLKMPLHINMAIYQCTYCVSYHDTMLLEYRSNIMATDYCMVHVLCYQFVCSSSQVEGIGIAPI